MNNLKNLGLTGLTGMANPGRTRNGNLLVDLAKVSRVQGSALDEANIFPKAEKFLRRAAKALSFCSNNVKLNFNYVIKHNGEACFMIQIYKTKSFIVAWLIYDELRIAKCV